MRAAVKGGRNARQALTRRNGRRIPGRRRGGPVKAGEPYVVGEAGPELFVPRQSGRIVPRGARRGGLGRVAQSIMRAPGRGFAGLARYKRSLKLSPMAKGAILGVVGGVGAFAVHSVLDRMGMSNLAQAGIFAGFALGLALVGQVQMAGGVLGVAAFELLKVGWERFRDRFPETAKAVEDALPGGGGAAAPEPTRR